MLVSEMSKRGVQITDGDADECLLTCLDSRQRQIFDSSSLHGFSNRSILYFYHHTGIPWSSLKFWMASQKRYDCSWIKFLPKCTFSITLSLSIQGFVISPGVYQRVVEKMNDDFLAGKQVPVHIDISLILQFSYSNILHGVMGYIYFSFTIHAQETSPLDMLRMSLFLNDQVPFGL